MIQNINVGSVPNTGTGDKLRDAFIIVNQNFLDIQNILDVVLTEDSIIPISQINGLQTILDDLTYNVGLIPQLQDEISSINSVIYSINKTLNSQNSSINDLYSLVNDLQQQIYTKIGDAPIDGQQYVRKDGDWVIISSITGATGATGFTGPQGIQGPQGPTGPSPDTSLFVPYTGANKNLDLGTYGLTATSLQFTGLTNSGRLTWNDTDGTADLTLKGGNVTLQIGQENVVRVVNKTATNIDLLESNYQVVRVTGAQGNRLKVDLAQATSDSLSAETIGLVTETILNNQEGFITTSGLVRGINTTGSLQGETWNDGDMLYLSPTTAGQITKTKPVAPNHLIVIGYVVRSHITQGSIFVKVDNGYELDELHNVKITGTPSNNSLLIYGTSSVWENRTLVDTLRTFNLNQGIYFFEEFLGQNDNSGIPSSTGITMGSSGTGAVNRITGTFPNRTNQIGVALLATGTTTTGNSSLRLGSNNAPNLYLGVGTLSCETYINIETLSNSTDRYIWGSGLMANANYLAAPQGAYFIYDEGGAYTGNPFGASPNFRAVTVSSGLARTITNTNISMTASSWYKLRIEVNSNNTQILFYINETLVATHTTNLPSISQGLFYSNWIIKTAGTTSVQTFSDYLALRYSFTNTR